MIKFQMIKNKNLYNRKNHYSNIAKKKIKFTNQIKKL